MLRTNYACYSVLAWGTMTNGVVISCRECSKGTNEGDLVGLTLLLLGLGIAGSERCSTSQGLCDLPLLCYCYLDNTDLHIRVIT